LFERFENQSALRSKTEHVQRNELASKTTRLV